MLTMIFIYFNIWQIKKTAPHDFEMAMIGFKKELKKELMDATSPFTFWRVNEINVMRFMKLIGCDNAKVGSYAALVKERNETAHTNGNIFFSTQAALDAKIREIIRVVKEIQAHSKPTVERCYREFLLDNYDPEERAYQDAADQLREELIHVNYMSQKDIDFCLSVDVSEFHDRAEFPQILQLHLSLKAAYGEEFAGADRLAPGRINR